jgi:hypothetical protein
VHVVVRQPSKLAAASRLCKLRPDQTAARPLACRLAVARRASTTACAPARFVSPSFLGWHRLPPPRFVCARPRAVQFSGALGLQALPIRHVFNEHRCLTPDITGPPNGLTSNHVNLASAAPVHVLVRQPSKFAAAFRVCKLPRRHSRAGQRPVAKRLRGGRIGQCLRQRGSSASDAKPVSPCASEIRLRTMPMVAMVLPAPMVCRRCRTITSLKSTDV